MFKSLPSFKVKSLPQAMGLPFLSTQEDAQLKFRSGEGGIKRLYGEEVGLASIVMLFRIDCEGSDGRKCLLVGD
jgi:hypothetical protein